MNKKLHHIVCGLLLLSGASLNAQEEQNSGKAQEITEVRQAYAVTVSTSEVIINGERYLKIHLKNSDNTSADVVWSLLKGDEIIISKKRNLLAGASTNVFFDASMPIVLQEKDLLENYTVILH